MLALLIFGSVAFANAIFANVTFANVVFVNVAFARQDDDNTRISYGEVVEGFLDDEGFRDLYIFGGRQGEVITITMTVIEGDLDPFISLVDERGVGIAFNDDGGAGNTAVLDSIRIPADGQFFVIATRFGHEFGSTSGDYSLTVERLGATVTSGARLRYGDSVVGEINSNTPQTVYYFTGERGDVVDVRMNRTSGNLDPFIDIANPQGQIIRSGDDDPTAIGTLNAGIINYTLPETGVYLVVATRYGRASGETSGSYLLSVSSIPESQRGQSPGNAILLDYGEVINSSLGSESPQRFYVFEGTRGDVVTVDMQRTLGNLQTFVLLLDFSLNEVARAGGTQPLDRARIIGYTLPEDGQYFIMAARNEFSEGETEGDFQLSLNGREGVGGSELLEIAYDIEKTGVINDDLPVESFVFEGQAGDVISIRMDAISDNLDPLVTLFLDGKQIAFDDDSGDGKNAAIIDFTLPEDGLYHVEAARFNRDQGQTSGSYVLVLEAR